MKITDHVVQTDKRIKYDQRNVVLIFVYQRLPEEQKDNSMKMIEEQKDNSMKIAE